MTIHYPLRLATSADEIAENINSFLKSIGSTMKVTRKYIEELQLLNLVLPLDDRQFLTQVDDELKVVENLAPEMIFATRGKLGVVLQNGESVSQIVDQVLESQPTTVLMDYKLQGDFTGIDVTQRLLKEKSQLHILGFSSNPALSQEFLDAGARGFVTKDASKQEETIRALIAEFTRIGA